MEISKEREVQGVGDNTATCTCQQCNENLHIQDTKPTYNPSGEIVGRICNHCRIKNVEYARRCQILGCKAPESKNPGFRTLPAKFYDLEEGDVKIRIVKQFGITESTRACCNMCYLRISKAIVQMKIVYGDGVLKTDFKKKTAKDIKSALAASAGSRVLHNKEAPVGATQDMKESRPSAKGIENEHQKSPTKYTGPQFKRKYGTVPTWFQQQKVRKVGEERTEVIISNSNVNNQIVGADNKDGNASINVDSKQKDAGVNYDKANYDSNLASNLLQLDCHTGSFRQPTGNLAAIPKEQSVEESREISTHGNLVPLSKSTNLCLGGVFSAGGIVVQSNVADGEHGNQAQINDNSANSQANRVMKYSTVSISPTTTRFCRILPKPSELIQGKLATTIDNQVRLNSTGHGEEKGNDKKVERIEIANKFSEKSSVKEIKEGDDGESDWSSCDTSSTNQSERLSEKGARKQRRRRSNLESEITSDIVSCMGCHKICSVREAKPVFDYEKGFCGRLCNECRIKKREDNKKCPIKGCKTPFKDVVLKPVPPRVLKLKGKLKHRFNLEYGLTKDTKVCCRVCWKKINTLLKSVRIKSKQLKSMGLKNSENSKSHEEVLKNITDREKESSVENTSDTSTDEKCYTFTMCRGCYRIVPMNQTVPNIENNGRRCGVLCRSCAGITASPAGEKGDGDPSLRKPESWKMSGVCRVKGCVGSGHVVSLVSCERLLKASENEKIVRKEFDLDSDNNVCCRSCLARIKWFINAYIGKKMSHFKTGNVTGREGNVISSEEQQSIHFQEAQVQCGPPMGQPHKVRNCSQQKNRPQSPKLVPFTVNGDTGILKEMPILPKGPVLERSNHIPFQLPHPQLIPNTPQVVDPLTVNKGPPESSFRNFGNLPYTNVASPPVNPVSSHPPVLQVGGQQFVLNVIRRTDQVTQTTIDNPSTETREKAVQCVYPLQLNTSGQVASVRRVTYQEAKEKTKYIIKKQGRHLFDQFLAQLDEISGGFGKQLLQDVYYSKETVMASNYEKILSSLGMQYHNTEKANKTEKLRILSLVALYASNELLKKHFQRPTKKGELTSVTEGEIAQAREYAKQFGPGAFVMPEKVAELSKNKGLLLFPNDSFTEPKEESESPSKEPSSTAVTEPSIIGAPVTVVTPIPHFEPTEAKKEEHIGPPIQAPVPLYAKPVEGKKENTVDVKVSNSVEMVQLKFVKKIAGVPVVDFGSALPSQTQITSPNVPFIATFKYNPKLSVAPTDRKEVKQVPKTEETQPLPNILLANLGPKERLHKKLKKKAFSASASPKKFPEDKEKGKKSPNSKLKLFKRSKMLIDNNDPKGKRMRTSFTREEREMLEQYFQHSMYVTKDLMRIIQGQMGLDKKKIDTWFRNRRSKAKKAESGKTGGAEGTDTNQERRKTSSNDSILANGSDNSTSGDLVMDETETSILSTSAECSKMNDSGDIETSSRTEKDEKNKGKGLSPSKRETGSSLDIKMPDMTTVITPTAYSTLPKKDATEHIDDTKFTGETGGIPLSSVNKTPLADPTRFGDLKLDATCEQDTRLDFHNNKQEVDSNADRRLYDSSQDKKIDNATPSKRCRGDSGTLRIVPLKNDIPARILPSNLLDSDVNRSETNAEKSIKGKGQKIKEDTNSTIEGGKVILDRSESPSYKATNENVAQGKRALEENNKNSPEKESANLTSGDSSPVKLAQKKLDKEDLARNIDHKKPSNSARSPAKRIKEAPMPLESDEESEDDIVTPRKVPKRSKKEAASPRASKAELQELSKGQKSEVDYPKVSRKENSEGSRGNRHDEGSPRSSRRDGHERTKSNRNDHDSSHSSNKHGSESQFTVMSPKSCKKEGGDKGKSMRGNSENCRLLKKESDKSRSSRNDPGSPRLSKRETSDDRSESGSPRLARKDSSDRVRPNRSEPDITRTAKKDENKTREGKERLLSKKTLDEDEDKSSSRRRGRSRANLSTDKDSSDMVAGEEDEDLDTQSIKSQHNSPFEKSGNGTAYETRSRTR